MTVTEQPARPVGFVARYLRTRRTRQETTMTDTVTTTVTTATAATAWPEDIIARYLTLAGATVDLFRANPNSTYIDSGHCTGCGHPIDWTAEEFGRKEAQGHAEKCRALPRPEGN